MDAAQDIALRCPRRVKRRNSSNASAARIRVPPATTLAGTAQGALASTAANVPEIERQIVLKENQISVLIGRNPGPVAHNATLNEQVMPPEVPAGLPSALLERRPDLRQAEQNLRSSNAQVGVSVAEFFPKIGLTTFFGRSRCRRIQSPR